MTNLDKILAFNKCLNKTYKGRILEPITNEIYELFGMCFDIEILLDIKISDEQKIETFNTFFPLFYRVVKTNNIELFKKVVNELFRYSRNMISSDLIVPLFDLLLDPQLFFQKKEHRHFKFITKYLLEEKKHSFYHENSNYLYFDYLSKHLDCCMKYNVKRNSFGILAIYYFLKNNIEYDKFIPVLDYVFANYDDLNTFLSLNYDETKKDELINVIMEKVLNEISNEHIVIK